MFPGIMACGTWLYEIGRKYGLAYAVNPCFLNEGSARRACDEWVFRVLRGGNQRNFWHQKTCFDAVKGSLESFILEGKF